MNFGDLGLFLLMLHLSSIMIFFNVPLLFLSFIFKMLLERLKEKPNNAYSLKQELKSKLFLYIKKIFKYLYLTIVAGVISFYHVEKWSTEVEVVDNPSDLMIFIGMIICICVLFVCYEHLLMPQNSLVESEESRENKKGRKQYLLSGILALMISYIFLIIGGKAKTYLFVQMHHSCYDPNLSFMYGAVISFLILLTPLSLVLINALSFSFLPKKLNHDYLIDNYWFSFGEKRKMKIQCEGKYSAISLDSFFAIICLGLVFGANLQNMRKDILANISIISIFLFPSVILLFLIYWTLLKRKNNYLIQEYTGCILRTSRMRSLERLVRFSLCVCLSLLTVYIIATNIITLILISMEWSYKVNNLTPDQIFYLSLSGDTFLYIWGVMILAIYVKLFFYFDKTLF